MNVQLDLHPTPFAYLLDQPGMVAVLTYEFPVQSTPAEAYFAWVDSMKINYSVLPCNEPLVLPFLNADDAEEVALNSYHSGAPLYVCAAVAAQRGVDALYDYADTQNVYSMPGAPALSEDELRFIGSGL